MSLHYVVSRKLSGLLLHPAFRMSASNTYWNEFDRAGQRLIGTMDGTQIFVSESDALVATSCADLARVLAHPDRLDERKSIVYRAKRRGGIGVRIEAWSGGRWYHIFIPIACIEFLSPLIAEILELARRSVHM